MLLRYLVAALLVQSPASVLGDSVQLPAEQDNSIVLQDGEWEVNAGRQARIRIKGNQHIVAMGFETSPLVGKRIRRATLVCTPSEQSIEGVTISTIAAPWDELESNGLHSGVEGTSGWDSAGGRFPAVIGGNAFSLVHSVPSERRDGNYHWDVPPDMVYAMTLGVAHGLAIHEHSADHGRNPT